jgi:K319-like protein
MKTAVSFLRCVVRLIGRGILPATTIGVFVLGISVAHAQTLPQATSYISTQAGPSSTSNAVSFNDVIADNSYDNFQAGSGYTADGKISVSFGTNAPVAITGQAFTTTSQLYAQAYATAGANLRFYFRVVQVGNPPWQPPSIPTLFEASGRGEVLRGYGRFDATAVVPDYQGFPSNLFKINWEGHSNIASFGQPVTLDLPINNQYLVLLGATAFAYSAFNLDKESNVYVYVDPIISFDQATFNARYPQSSFPLSDYYRLEFSSNLNLNPPLTDPERQVTFELDEQTTPTLGRDAIGDYVVFTSYTPVGSGTAQSDIYYQRLVNGQPVGNRVPVAVTALDERLNDCSGDYIVYTQFESVTSTGGKIILYQISTGQTSVLNSAADNFFPKIHGDVVVWLKTMPMGNLAVMYRISSYIPGQYSVLAGPIPNPRDVEVGDRFVVWSQLRNDSYDVMAYDLSQFLSISVASDETLDERSPTTDGPWVAYQVSSRTNPSDIAIHAANIVTGEIRIIADNSGANGFPNISGNLLSYESNVSGNWDVYVYRFAETDTLQVTTRTDDQRLNDVKGNLVAYVDARNGNQDVFVSTPTFNIPPIANAGPDQSIHANGLVTLDGSGSSDPDGNPITYAWSFLSRPAGSSAAFSNPAAVNATFTPDLPGDYTIQLIVTDSLGAASQPDQVVISTWNSAPIAEAGQDQAISLIGTTVHLDGTQSYDPDGDPITYEWTFASMPQGSNATLISANTASPTFLADLYGTYLVRLIVSDRWTQSGDTMSVSFANVQPVANAGTSQSASVGEAVSLDGSSSSDANGDALTFRWSITSFPGGSVATIANPTAMITTFVPDLAGTYVFQLVVNDGLLDSVPSTTQVQAIADSSVPIEATQDVQVLIASLNPSVFKNATMQKTFNNKLNAVIADIEAGNYANALDKLQNDILGKTDGCANSGAPDSNDWIKDCVSQGEVYPLILEVIEMLRSL